MALQRLNAQVWPPPGYISVERINRSSEAELAVYIDEYINIIHTTTPPKYEEMAHHILDLFWEGYPNQEKEAYGSFIHSLVKHRGQDTLAFYRWLLPWIATGVVYLEDVYDVRETLKDELVSQGHQVAGTRKNIKRRRSVSRKRRKNRKTKKGGRRISRKRRKSSKKSNRKSKRRTNKSRRRRK